MDKIICVFCDMECQPAPTQRGWSSAGTGKGLHFDCAQKVVDSKTSIDSIEKPETIPIRHLQQVIKNIQDLKLKPEFNGHYHDGARIMQTNVLIILNNVRAYYYHDPKSDDTVIFAGKKNNITFLKSYNYAIQKEEAQKDLTYVRDKDNGFTFWYISAMNDIWTLNREKENIEHSFKLPKFNK